VRSFLTPQLDQPRVSLLWDSASPEKHRDHFLSSAVSIVKDKGATLRILYRGETPSPTVINDALQDLGKEGLWGLEITGVPVAETYSDIPFYAAEITLATSWSSARALRFVAEEENSWVLTPAALGADGHESVNVTANTPDIQQRMALESLPWPSTKPAAIPAGTSAKDAKEGAWRLGILADPKESPIAFSIALESVSSWLRVAKGESEIFLLSSVLEPFSFMEEIQPHRMGAGAPLDAVLAMTQAELTASDFTLWGEPQVVQVVPDFLAAPNDSAQFSPQIRRVNAHVETVAYELTTLHQTHLMKVRAQ